MCFHYDIQKVNAFIPPNYLYRKRRTIARKKHQFSGAHARQFSLDFSAWRVYILVWTELMNTLFIRVSGVVQGVGYRYFIMQVARRLGLTGYVKNLYTGEVEIVAEGDSSALNQLIEEAKVGPASSDVRDMHIEWKEPASGFSGFDIQF